MLVSTAIAAVARTTRAQCTPLQLGQCNIDLFQGPVLAPARATGLGGAFAAYAEGVDAITSNAAAVAVREPYSFSWFDYDLSLGISFPAAFRGTDFDNDGEVGFTYSNFLFYNFGADVQIGAWGVGVLGDFQNYDLLPATQQGDQQVTETLGKLHAVLGRTFFGGQLAVAGGARIVTLSIDSKQNGTATNELGMSGLGTELSALIRPDFEPWRIGATFRAPVEGRSSSTTRDNGAGDMAFVAPASLFLPWELEVGAALQVGPRPFNPKWLDPHEQEAHERQQIQDDRAARRAAQEAELRGITNPGSMFDRARELSYQETFIRREEDRRLDQIGQNLLAERRARYANWPRERITVLLDVLVSGRAPDSLGLESFFAEQAALHDPTSTAVFRRSGQRISYSPRLGLEGEPVPDRVQTRIGTYIEPSRFGGLSRQHFTFGFDVKLFPWSVFGLAGDIIWRVGGVADLAPRYQSLGLSLGAWH